MPGPFEQFVAWHREAIAVGEADPDAMTLATVSAAGRVSSRTVLYRGIDDRGPRFFTNYLSRKGRELRANPGAALLFYWPVLHRQVRIEGRVELLDAALSDAYFAARPRGHQLGAWASAQSEPIASLEDLDARYSEFERNFAGHDVPRPSHWGGYRVLADRMEFWQARDNRLHERMVYERTQPNQDWQSTRLSP